MSENNSSAVHKTISVGSKFQTSTISENAKTGELGDMPISVKAMEANANTELKSVSEDFGSESGAKINATEMSPAGKPSSSFINTSAVK